MRQLLARQTPPDPGDYLTYEDYSAAAQGPWSDEYLRGRWDETGLGTDIIRVAFILGSKVLGEEATRLGTGMFRGVHPRDVASLAAGQGMDPVAGTNPLPAADAAEMSFRHLRPVPKTTPLPSWSPHVAGSDRISWATDLGVAAKRATGWDTYVARLKDIAPQLGTVIRTPQELLQDLDAMEARLQAALATAASRTKQRAIAWDLDSIKRAREHVTNLAEWETVGHVPQNAVISYVLEKIQLLKVGGYVLLGLAMILSAWNILAADPDRHDEVAIDEAASWAAGWYIPWAGPMGSYATQSARGEFHPATMVLPIPFMWMLDAYLGPAMEANDPAGAAKIRAAIGSPLLETQMYMEMFHM